MAVDDLTTREVVADAWGLSVAVGEPRYGPRRTTWRVGDDLWLASADGADAEAVAREAELLAVAAPIVADAGVALPRIVPTTTGALAHRDGSRVWRLCVHVDGESVDPREPSVWPDVAAFVARLDAALRVLPHDLAVRPEGVLESGLREVAMSSDDPDTTLHRARDVVASHADELSSLSVQLLHGDCHTPNLRVRSGRIVGAIDLEFAAVDPPIIELASPAANLIFDSELDDIARRLHALWDDWRRAGGEGSYEALEAALVLTRLHFHRLTRERFPGDARRIGIAAEFVQRAMDVVGV